MSCKKKVYINPMILFVLVLAGGAFAQNPPPKTWETKALSTEERIMGLVTIWSEAKYNFPWFDKFPDLNWDAQVQAYLPKVIAARDTVEYYRILMEFAVLLKDGHTSVRPPWFPFLPNEDTVPLDVQIVDHKVIIAGCGESDEIKIQGILPGMEILTAEAGIPIMTYFQDKVYRLYTAGSAHANTVWGVFLFFGERNSVLNLTIKDFSGQVRQVSLTRNNFSGGQPFFFRYMRWNVIEQSLEAIPLTNGILYVRIPSFRLEDLDRAFTDLIDTLDPAQTTGLIIDLRFNAGGNSAIAGKMVAALIDREACFPIMRYRPYITAYRAWGKEAEPLESKTIIKPRQGKRFLGPVVILTGFGTASTAEDFTIALKYVQRALLVGEKTAGSAGNALAFPLPGGGTFEVSTFRACLPDGREYVHLGVAPDVEVRTTQDDIRHGIDPVLNKGIEVIADWPGFHKK